jgi:hypothetical protein
VHRTGSGEWHRFAFRPEFEGEVKSGRRYILVDDVFSQGGSLNELRVYIERRGGKAVQTIAMALGEHGDSIAPDAEGTKKLLDKFGKDKIDSFMEDIGLYEGHSNCLTGPETCSLRRAASLDAARDRIFEARQEGRARMGVEGPGRCGASAVSSGAQSESDAEDPPYHRHARRRGRGRGI